MLSIIGQALPSYESVSGGQPFLRGCLAYRIDDMDGSAFLVFATDLERQKRTEAAVVPPELARDGIRCRLKRMLGESRGR
jgi:hypothetical protein